MRVSPLPDSPLCTDHDGGIRPPRPRPVAHKRWCRRSWSRCSHNRNASCQSASSCSSHDSVAFFGAEHRDLIGRLHEQDRGSAVFLVKLDQRFEGFEVRCGSIFRGVSRQLSDTPVFLVGSDISTGDTIPRPSQFGLGGPGTHDAGDGNSGEKSSDPDRF